jgi:translation initiation factor 2B subunit (eIF-2B alpha/beta/delta family)
VQEKSGELKLKFDALQTAENEPGRLLKWAETVEKAASSMDNEMRVITRKIKNFDAEIEKQAKRRIEAEKLRKSLLEKLELNRQTIEQREQDVTAVKANLETSKTRHRDLVATKIALQSKRKDAERYVCVCESHFLYFKMK